MKRKITITFLIFFGIITYGQKLTLEEFQKKVGESGLQFTMPNGYKIKEVKKNNDLKYIFAIINTKGTIEVRYSLFPMKQMLEEYEKTKKNQKMAMIDPNNVYVGLMTVNGINMTNGTKPKIEHFSTEKAKNEFNADYAGKSFFKFDCEFGKDYKYGQFVCLHKENIADVIITFMTNEVKDNSEFINIPLHSLTFK